MKEIINILEFEISLSILAEKTTAFWADDKAGSLSHGPLVGKHFHNLIEAKVFKDFGTVLLF